MSTDTAAKLRRALAVVASWVQILLGWVRA